MRTEFIAYWHDNAKCEAVAKSLGWNPESGDGYLDIYHPDEDSRGSSTKTFTELRKAVSFMRDIVKKYGTVFGQGEVREIEIDGPQCKYCVCRGRKLVRVYYVSDEGIDDKQDESSCLNDED